VLTTNSSNNFPTREGVPVVEFVQKFYVMFHPELTSCRTYACKWLSFGEPKFSEMLLRKEVIQPHLPVRLPCYDLVPITNPTFDGSLLAVRPPASGVIDFRDLTGGVYKARERIHRSVADLRLLATPTS
jgi:hypothetical protein